MTDSPGLRAGVAAGCAALLLALTPARAQSSPFHLRASAGAGTMLGGDQTGRLHYDEFGMLGDIRLGYAALAWLDVSKNSCAQLKHDPPLCPAPEPMRERPH